MLHFTHSTDHYLSQSYHWTLASKSLLPLVTIHSSVPIWLLITIHISFHWDRQREDEGGEAEG